MHLPDRYVEMFSEIDIPQESNFNQVLRVIHYLRFKVYTQILNVMYHTGFSSISEIRGIISCINLDQIKRCRDCFIRDGIISELSKDHENYELIKAFWSTYYIHSPYTPQIYLLNPEWINILSIFEKLLSKYTLTSSQITINRRADAFERHKNMVEAQNKSRQEHMTNAIGTCSQCNLIIRSNYKQGKQYYQYGSLFLCKRCHQKASVTELKKLVRQNKNGSDRIKPRV